MVSGKAGFESSSTLLLSFFRSTSQLPLNKKWMMGQRTNEGLQLPELIHRRNSILLNCFGHTCCNSKGLVNVFKLSWYELTILSEEATFKQRHQGRGVSHSFILGENVTSRGNSKVQRPWGRKMLGCTWETARQSLWWLQLSGRD